MAHGGLTSSEKRRLDKLLLGAASFQKDWAGISAGVLISLMRKRLHMTQGHLAERAGLPQSYISRLEREAVIPRVDTLRAIFSAMGCDLFFVPSPRYAPDKLLEQQARKAALKRIEYLAGTMAMEEERPSDKALEELVEDETRRLLDSGVSEIWNI